MAIPPIPSYPIPVESELPQPMVDWRPDPARAVLLIHDMQSYFLEPFPADKPPRSELVPNIRRLRDKAKSLGMPVLYTAQPGGMTRTERGLLHDFWGPGMDRDLKHREIIPELTPDIDDTVLTKWRYSAFVRSDLDERMPALGRDQMIVCGVYAHVGCLITACDAFSRDFETFFVADAVADFTEEYHMLGVRYAAERCAVTLSTRGLLELL